jgi:hypothetical protein
MIQLHFWLPLSGSSPWRNHRVGLSFRFGPFQIALADYFVYTGIFQPPGSRLQYYDLC